MGFEEDGLYMTYKEALELSNRTNNMKSFSLVIELNLCPSCKHYDCPLHDGMDDNEVITRCRYYVSEHVCIGCVNEGRCDQNCEEGEMFYPKED